MKLADLRVAHGRKLKLAQRATDGGAALRDGKAGGREALEHCSARLEALQELLYAEGRHRLLVVLQAMDAGGKDSTIRHVFQGVDPLGVRVASFGPPSVEEGARDYLWRVHRHVPRSGEIAIFNRSHYEDVLVPRVSRAIDAAECRRRYRQINDFERMLVETGTTIVKVYLHVSRDEQKKRLEARRDDPEKQWKFRFGDLAVRAQWDAYMAAYEAALAATSTARAPWYVIPADDRLARNLLVSQLLIEALQALDMRYPDPLPGVSDAAIV